MLAGGDRPGLITLRDLALVLVVVLALPATLAIARASRTTREPNQTPARRRLETVWVIAPIVLLAGLIALSAAA